MFDHLEKIEKRYEELEQILGSNQAISDREQYNRYAKELSDLKDAVSLFREYKEVLKQSKDLEGELSQKHDLDFLELIKREIAELSSRKIDLEDKLKKQLTGEDKDLGRDIMVEIRPGTGGLEAGLFAADLYRMYTQYAAAKGWGTEVMSSHYTELGGVKEIVFSVKGREAYKRLKFESGVHRVQRVPETEAQGRIHTSTATVAVMVEPKEVDLVIEPKDLRIDTYRASGPGGQHMQKSDSAVRITHIPSGVVVACQDERSQLKNKTKAMRILAARLLDSKKQEEAKKMAQERKSQIGTGDRSEKIRTYNFPDRRVTDHRINFSLYRLEAVLDGDLDELSEALLAAEAERAGENKV